VSDDHDILDSAFFQSGNDVGGNNIFAEVESDLLKRRFCRGHAVFPPQGSFDGQRRLGNLLQEEVRIISAINIAGCDFGCSEHIFR